MFNLGLAAILWWLTLQSAKVLLVEDGPSGPRRRFYGLSIMRIGQSGKIFWGDDHPLQRPQKSGQTGRPSIPEAFGLIGLGLFLV